MATRARSSAKPAAKPEASTDAEPYARPPELEARRADDAWQAARRRVADRNDQVRKRGQKERREHDNRIAAYRRAAGDGPTPRVP
jgi:hypothetical protein